MKEGAETANKASRKKVSQKAHEPKPVLESTALQRRYGQIGIPAVAAAARYQGAAKNPAYAPATHSAFKDAGEAA